MTLLPLFNQFIIPTFLSVYAMFSSLFPHAAMQHTKAKTVATNEKKVVFTQKNPSVTPAKITGGHSTSYTNDDGTHAYASDTTEPINTPKTETNNTSLSVTTTPAPSTTTQPTISQTITATTTMSASGRTIHLTMKYPSLGGNITGTISGDCSGTLSGVYDGPSTQNLSGKGSATCPIGFISVPVEISYSGKLTSSTNAQINYTVNALGKTELGSTNLTLLK